MDGMPRTLAELRELGPLEFQNWVIDRMLGVHSARKSHDNGDRRPLVLRAPPDPGQAVLELGREALDKFETAIGRSGKHAGYLVALGCGKYAVEEAARSKKTDRAVILVKVEDIRRVGELVDTAEAARQQVDLSAEPPDLIGLVSRAQQSLAEKQPQRRPRRAPKVSTPELFRSVKETEGSP
jgi:hypothetical protein